MAAAPASRLDSLAGGSLLIAGARGASIAANAAVSIVAARLLGPEGIGAMAVGLALYSVLMLGSALGLGVGASWLVGGGRWDPRSALASTAVAGLAIGAVAACVGAIAFLLGRDSVFDGVPTAGMVAVLVSVPLALAWSHAANVAVAARRYDVGAALPAVQAAFYVALVWLLASEEGVSGALWGLLASQAAAALAALAWARGAFRSPGARARLDLGRVREAISFGAAAWVGHILAVAVQRSDLFLLNATNAREEVGHYAVAVAVTTPLWVMPSGLGSVLMPRLAGLEDAGGLERNRAEAAALRYAAVLLAAAAALVAILVLALLPAVYGDAFRDSREPALILIPGTIALGLSFVATASLSGRGRPREFMLTWVMVLPVAAVLYGLLVPYHGAVGAAAASSAAYVLAAAISGTFLMRDRRRDREQHR